MKGKVHERATMVGGRQAVKRIVAICDAELLGRVFEEGDMVLDLEKYRGFYEGTEMDEGQVAEILKGAKNINLVGKKTIAAAGKILKINDANVRKIQGVPLLQIYYL